MQQIRAPRRRAPRKPAEAEADQGVVHVELSPRLREKIGEVAKINGQSETEFIREALAEAISRRGMKKPN